MKLWATRMGITAVGLALAAMAPSAVYARHGADDRTPGAGRSSQDDIVNGVKLRGDGSVDDNSNSSSNRHREGARSGRSSDDSHGRGRGRHRGRGRSGDS